MAKLWPTPDASVMNLSESVESVLARRTRCKETANNGNGFGLTLATAVKMDGSSPEVSPARISPLPERGLDSPGAGRVFGTNSIALLTRYDHATSSWRTSQHSLFGDLTEFSGAWPRSGTMRSGSVYERQTWVRRTDGNESGLLPTPTMGDSKSACNATATRHNPESKHHAGTTLTDAARTWPTPTSRDWKDGSYCPNVPVNSLLGRAVWPTPHANSHTGPGEHGEGGPNLQTAVTQLPTPTANRRTGLQSHGVNVVKGQLSADWVDLLQGYPRGWTDGKMEYHVSLLKSRTE